MAAVKESGMCVSCFSETKLKTANLKCANFFCMRCSVFEEEEETLGLESNFRELKHKTLLSTRTPNSCGETGSQVT